jgi:UDP-N-acetylglucosamine acyltransferase
MVSPYSGVHQFCRVGRHAMIGPHSVITQDVMPFSMTVSEREVKTFGANATGLERRGFSAPVRDGLHKAFRLLTRAGLNTSQAIEHMRAEIEPFPELDELIAFIQASSRGVIK